MANKTGSITLGTAGSAREFTGVGFTPNFLRFTVGPKNGDSANLQLSIGAVDSAGNEFCVTRYNDPSVSHAANQSSTDCIYVRELVSGSWTTVLKADFHSFTSDGFKLNVTTANSNYTVFFEAFS